MASFSHHFLISLFIYSIVFINHVAKCEENDMPDQEDGLLQGINRFRASLNMSALIENDDAECYADEIADQFQAQPCTNVTSFNVTRGIRPRVTNNSTLLAKCELIVNRTRDGIVLPTCVPNSSLFPALVLSNYTMSQYSQYLKDSNYTGIGIQTEDNWTVVVLTTNTSGGSFLPIDGNYIKHRASFSIVACFCSNCNLIYDLCADDLDETDEDDNLFRGINSFRYTLNLTALIENEKAECLADKIADRFDNQLCTPSATGVAGAYTPASPQFSNYTGFLTECGLNINTTRAGIILPACVPNLVPSLVVSNYTMTQYSQYLNGTNYTGIGIGTEDHYVVVVLTTNTAEGSFMAASSIGTGISSQASGLSSSFSYLMLLLTGLLILLH
ncbi:hypothetical protein Leryth_003757 [Lithospermum erythrorhizon]|nr:hypothetical protein Leryth_003757 [Lithospermum erythrorhizon]